MRHRAFSLWQAAALLCGIGVLAMVIYPVFERAKRYEHPYSCLSNLKQISMGIQQYVQDYDYALPPVASGREGWADLVQPYLKSRKIFYCPSVEPEREDITSDYFFNSRLTAVTLAKSGKQKIDDANDYFPEPSQTIMLGDGTARAGTNSAQSSLGPSDQPNSPARRHFDGANYSFVDGHVRYFKPNWISDRLLSRPKNRPTFAVK